ncbi:DUF1272 domain-containing protein [Paraburkholderia sp. SUR17]|uniref:DUF1272 domain-containing protein n=1 Tax=Paraburkholderia sp. SUR17 TaxID=3034358 RepID=UPI002407BE83|nr:DUF1272 domain-containing protein [Paraburkholderia sp. SUR17]WEY41843.1 DUF1272 domain-containing protein [Paraburkholderia sp. SUR17]
MLELRPSCEACGKALPPDSSDAMICSFECTFCEACATTTLRNVCPNCGGGFEHRPVRPRAMLAKYPESTQRRDASVDRDSHARYLQQYAAKPPSQR